ncbi:polysaccharide ABC transporter ATP-binding protein [Tamlana sp. 2201CG12-4]|uniref:ABC transporter ATP-binding protein n=1 Tax=Tamlana sp. 2201CG12-4 TaxID=3112582 RepID=UPI002DB6C426|nr:polysaccharide ABC transporter ATP-binding protein [Tamlana sp. 2201CG12-4]MEC3907331.1 polysaccharide ABC transporter ATP-binding protein [Tamlana sp. 2201CG12-4]
MSETILKVENISKQYRLGLVGTGTISHDLNRWWYKVRGKEDPYLRIGETNDRGTKANSDYVWALKDINFEVKQGEVLGIIGKNGAGKSTLLKILSRVTLPTTGEIKTKGRIASLLEVGTGFHREMTGRENIYLNGAILGMTKKEITSKIDEIIDFSGCERYIDTPVKRYSSGMTVRLAFAVAAFLEPEILVVDEVLAVGDAEFQKKAIGKMQDISRGQGRTVLFVSHNMVAVKNLCTRVIVLKDGEVLGMGETENMIKLYLNDLSMKPQDQLAKSKFLSFVSMQSILGNNTLKIGEDFHLSITFKETVHGQFDYFYVAIEDDMSRRVLSVGTHLDNNFHDKFHFSKKLNCVIPKLCLVKGIYRVLVAIGTSAPFENKEVIENALSFEVVDDNFFENGVSLEKGQGVLITKVKWNLC